jgi:hypothetical protein
MVLSHVLKGTDRWLALSSFFPHGATFFKNRIPGTLSCIGKNIQFHGLRQVKSTKPLIHVLAWHNKRGQKKDNKIRKMLPIWAQLKTDRETH